LFLCRTKVLFVPETAGQHKTKVCTPDIDHTVKKIVAVVGIVGDKGNTQKRGTEGKSAVKEIVFPVPGRFSRDLAEDAEPGIDQGGNEKNKNERKSKGGNIESHVTPP
jgi:hypothetical protein